MNFFLLKDGKENGGGDKDVEEGDEVAMPTATAAI